MENILQNSKINILDIFIIMIYQNKIKTTNRNSKNNENGMIN